MSHNLKWRWLNSPRTSRSSVSSGRCPSLLLNSWGRDELLWNLHWLGITIRTSPSRRAPLIPSAGFSYSWVRGGPQTWKEMGGRKREIGDQEGYLSRSHLLCWGAFFLKHTSRGIWEGRGRIIQRTKKWASADMGAEVRRQAAGTLDLISGTSILLDSLGCQAGLRRNSCPWMAWEFRKR